jgi:hypothetical protein
MMSYTSFEIPLQFRLVPKQNTVRDVFQTAHLAASSEYSHGIPNRATLFRLAFRLVKVAFF